MLKRNKVSDAEFRRNTSQAWIDITISGIQFSFICAVRKRFISSSKARSTKGLGTFSVWPHLRNDTQKLSLQELREAETILTKKMNEQKVKDIIPVFVKLLIGLRQVIKAREKEVIDTDKKSMAKALNESYNKNHPELRKGEMFFTNVDTKGFRRMGWVTKRQGQIAYDVNGKVVQGHLPVFIQKSEYDINPHKGYYGG